MLDLIARIEAERLRRAYLRDVYGYEAEKDTSKKRGRVLQGPRPEVIPNLVSQESASKGSVLHGSVIVEQNDGRMESFPAIADCAIVPGDHLFVTGVTKLGFVTVAPGPTPQKRRQTRMNRNGDRRAFSWDDVVGLHGSDCHLCGKPTRRDLPPSHRLYGTIDHVIPIAAGGQHNIDNARPAHRSCNSRKGANVDNERGRRSARR